MSKHGTARVHGAFAKHPFFLITLFLCWTHSVSAQSMVQLTADRDNSIYWDTTGNTSNGVGDYLFAGTILQNEEGVRRGLLYFDVSNALPFGVTLDSVRLTLHMSRTIAQELPVTLHRLVTDWGEGESNAPREEGTGTDAESGDATWLHAFYDDVLWQTAGGDFVQEPSATAQVDGVGEYYWTSEQMLVDVEQWMAEPDSNFGWVLIGDEDTVPSAKRFDSRENEDSPRRPALTLYYSRKGIGPDQPLEDAFPNLPTFTRLTDLQDAGDGSNRLFVTELDGRIMVFDNHTTVASVDTFLAIDDRVTTTGGEQGLLSLAFHPEFPTNGYFYVHYQTDNPRRSVISRFELDPGDSTKGDPSSELILLEIEQPFRNHNGGTISFGPDGYLYISLGDGGSGGDPLGHGQNLGTLLATMLRIDVDNPSGGLEYGIPPDNPFLDNSQARPEIWAYGIRNGWRFSFDTETGDLWLGDVGQNRWEEINVILPGRNYGWSRVEGRDCFPRGSACNKDGIRFSVLEYFHDDFEKRSITGGFVYHGPGVEALHDFYIYADFEIGTVWRLEYDDQFEVVSNTELVDTDLFIVSFGTDHNEELYLLDFFGRIYRFTPDDLGSPPAILSPLDGAANVPVEPELRWSAARIGATATVEISNDPAFDDVIERHEGVRKDRLSVGPFPKGSTIFWRIRFRDGSAFTDWSQYSFTVESLPVPTLLSPEDESTDQSPFTTFLWGGTSPGLSSQIQLAADESFQSILESVSGLSDTTYTSGLLDYSTDVYWRVRFAEEGTPGPWSEVRRFTVAVGTSTSEDAPIPETIEVYPNPTDGEVSVRYSIHREAPIKVLAYDVLGRVVYSRDLGNSRPGLYDLNLDIRSFTPGLYWIRIGDHTARFTVVD